MIRVYELSTTQQTTWWPGKPSHFVRQQCKFDDELMRYQLLENAAVIDGNVAQFRNQKVIIGAPDQEIVVNVAARMGTVGVVFKLQYKIVPKYIPAIVIADPFGYEMNDWAEYNTQPCMWLQKHCELLNCTRCSMSYALRRLMLSLTILPLDICTLIVQFVLQGT